MSLHHLAFMVSACGFTVEETRHDYGYDLSIFTFDPDGAFENSPIFVQLKATDKIKILKSSGLVSFPISQDDIMTWESSALPVHLVVFDAIGRQAYGLYLQRYFQANGITAATMTNRSIAVHLQPIALTESAIRVWRDEKNAILEQIGAVTHV